MSTYRTAAAEFGPLGVNTRTINALASQGICRLADLRRLTARELARFHGIGPAAVAQLAIHLRPEGRTMEIHRHARTVSVTFDPNSLTAIDAWAIEGGAASRSEAVRLLVELGLKAKGRK